MNVIVQINKGFIIVSNKTNESWLTQLGISHTGNKKEVIIADDQHCKMELSALFTFLKIHNMYATKAIKFETDGSLHILKM